MSSTPEEKAHQDERARPSDPAKVKATPSMILQREKGTLDPPQTPDEIGRLREYRVNKILGEGGMGVVYLAWDSNLHRSVALKVMKRAIAENDQSRQRFLLEARATAAIDHDHIVTIYQVGDHNGIPYLVMKHLEGQTLEERLRKEKILPPKEAVRIAKQVAEGLQAAHSCNLIHRDIKPSNIWLEKNRDRVKILDFGLARIADSTDPNITQTGVILGTPAYMSPEQAGGQELDSRSDLFSLGTVLYRMVVGKSPFRGSNNLAILRSLSMDEPIPPKEQNPRIPDRLSKLIMKLLEKDANERPSTASSVAFMLESIEEDLGHCDSAEFQVVAPRVGSIDSTPPSTVTSPSIRMQAVPPYQVPLVASALTDVSLEQIALEPIEDTEPNVKDGKPAKLKESVTEKPVLSPKPKAKAEVSPILRKLAEQAAMQDEIEEPSYIIDSRSAVIEEWRRRQFWDNFPWRPILFVAGAIVAVTLISLTIYSFWPILVERFGV